MGTPREQRGGGTGADAAGRGPTAPGGGGAPERAEQHARAGAGGPLERAGQRGRDPRREWPQRQRLAERLNEAPPKRKSRPRAAFCKQANCCAYLVPEAAAEAEPAAAEAEPAAA